MTKFRSNLDFAAGYASNKQGFAIGIENYLHLKKETTAGTFVPPSVGTQGKSTSDAAPSTDITASLNRNLKAAVDGNAAVTANLASVVGLNSGTLIAAAVELAMNTALSAAGYDARVWVEFVGGKYVMHSQKTGTTSAVVITAAAALNLAVDLKMGVANTGVEAVGTAGGDFLFMTKNSLKVEQPFEMSKHRTGRQASSIIKKKKVASGDVECYLNMSTGGGGTVDSALSILLEGVLGRTISVAGGVQFDSKSPQSVYFSANQGNNAMGRQFNGCYSKSVTISLPGAGEAMIKLPLKARDGLSASIMQLEGALVASTNVIGNVGESNRFDVGALVMGVDPDGRTVLFGQDGAVSVASRVDGSDEVVLNGAQSLPDDGYLVPFLPHVFDQVGTDNPVTGLQGSVSFDNSATTIEEIRSVELVFDPKLEDQDNWYGADGNRGFIVGEKAEIMVKVEMLLSASQAKQIILAREFATANMVIVLGPASGRRMKFAFPKVYFKVPPAELPDSGSVVLKMEGIAVQSAPGQLDAITITYL